MASLPVPSDVYFQDFAFDLVTVEIVRNSQSVCQLQGLPNEERGRYIHFKYGSDILVGDLMRSALGDYVVKSLETDTYNGKPELIKAKY